MRNDEFKILPRGLQVWADAMRRRPKRWLAIDDDANGWPTWYRDRLVKTHEIAGIAEPEVLKQLTKELAHLADVGL